MAVTRPTLTGSPGGGGLTRPQLTALTGGAALLAAASWTPAVDDAYIVYRYVDRALAGLGATFNDGEWVEGYTSLLWTVVLGAATGLTRWDTHLVSVVLNALLLVATVPVLHGALRELAFDTRAVMLALLMFVGSVLYARAVFLGLELGLFGLLLAATYWALFRFWRVRSRRSAAWLGAAGAALFTTRPEALAVLPLLLGTSALMQPEARADGDHRWWTQLGTAALVWAGGVAAVSAVRLMLFGDLLPNSVAAKALSVSDPNLALELRAAIRDGLLYLVDAYRHVPTLAASVIAAAAVALSRRRVGTVIALLWPLLITSAAMLQNGGDWMPYWRFVLMYTPVYVLLAALFFDWLVRHPRGPWMGAALVGAHIAISVLQAPPVFADPAKRDDGTLQDNYERLGVLLNPVWITGDALMPESIGRIGYVAPAAYIQDPAGLTDRRLAHDPEADRSMYGRENWKYSLRRRPAVIAMHFWERQRVWASFGVGYPDTYQAYWIPPTQPPLEPRGLFVLIRRDREARYGPPVTAAGGRRITMAEAERLWERHQDVR